MENQLFKKLKNTVLNSDSFSSEENKMIFINYFKSCHRIKYNLLEDDLKIGASKVGGKPDLKSESNWPKYQEVFMTFFCQINLADISNSILPNSGLISFFVYADPENSYGGSREKFKIIFEKEVNELKRIDYPETLDKRSVFKTSEMLFYESISYPDDESLLVSNLFDKSDWKKKNNFYNQIEEVLIEFHNEGNDYLNEDKILGYDKSIQSSAENFWPYNYLNLKTWDEVELRKNDIDLIKNQFSLFLQIDISINPSKLNSYGGSPEVYFGIHNTDLMEHNFENILITFQDT